MGKTNKLTMKRLRARMAAFETVFDVVRLLKENDLDERALANSGFIDCDKRCNCYELWNHNVPCENCVTLRAFNEKRRTSKAEIIDGRAYEVVADYVEVDGKPYVLELIKEIEDSDNLTGGEENILDRRRVYFEKTYMDVLTGAYNRRYFEDKIKSGGVSAGVAMIDLDDFKIYNDLYGHDTGDRILGTIAAEMKKCLRSTDKLVRYGGDEFLVVMPGVRKEGFETTLHAIMKHVQNCEIAGYAAVKMSVSIGAAMCEDGNVEEAVSRADRLLYRAKKKKDDLVTDYGEYGLDDRDKYTVLVVDDSDINREILTEILKNEYKVLEADGGEAAIEIIRIERRRNFRSAFRHSNERYRRLRSAEIYESQPPYRKNTCHHYKRRRVRRFGKARVRPRRRGLYQPSVRRKSRLSQSAEHDQSLRETAAACFYRFQ